MDSIKLLKKDVVFKKLLEYGMFSEKLTKIFSSESFGKWIRAEGLTKYKNRSFSVVSFHLTRNNNAPRILEIPHPIAYYRLCNEIKKNWKHIIRTIGEVDDYSDRSMVTPKPNNLNHRLVSMLSYNMRHNDKLLILDKAFKSKYFVHADVANCYPSIYSHSIPWALVGHKEAKNNINDKTKWYNKLDFAIRSMQRNETIGIAIGPDTSSIISELIFSKIDHSLKNYNYLRFIDDFKCYCESKETADLFIRQLSKELEKYHLRLNTKKTTIIELPSGLDQDWVRELRAYANKFLSRKKLSRKQITTISEFLDLAIALSNKNPGDSPIRYAVKVLSKKKYTDNEVMAFTIMYLSRICFIYPYFIDIFDDILARNKPDKDTRYLLSKEINSIMQEHVDYSRSDVALWGIYLAIKYKFKIKKYVSYSNKLLKARDCLPVLFAYKYAKKTKRSTKKYYELVAKLIAEKNEDEWWLYIYQLYIDSPRKQVLKKIAYKDYYEDMRKGKVTFVNV